MFNTTLSAPLSKGGSALAVGDCKFIYNNQSLRHAKRDTSLYTREANIERIRHFFRNWRQRTYNASHYTREAIIERTWLYVLQGRQGIEKILAYVYTREANIKRPLPIYTTQKYKQ